MTRREFLTAAGIASALPLRAQNTKRTISARPQAPYKSAWQHLQPEADEFACEREASIIEHHLNLLLQTRSLPLAPGFKGKSPVATHYKPVAHEVTQAEFDNSELSSREWQDAVRTWIDSLHTIRSAQFYALPDNHVRYEVTTTGAHRVGHWRQVWRDGKLIEFEPIDETLVRSPQPAFEDVTQHCLETVASFRTQLLQGNPWWRARLDAATGIDIYGNNGIAVGDIDNDGQDEIYVCQPGGLPNRLYKVRADGTFDDITENAGVGVLDDTTSALFVDFRNSGFQDLVVLRGPGPIFFRNDGTGRFTPQPDAFRFRTDPQGSFTGMAAADYDRDGKVDLYLCCYVYFQSEDQYRYPVPYHDAQNGPTNFLFRNQLNDNGGWFEDVTESTGLGHNNNRYSFAPAWCDYDNSGWPSLYVANDFGRNNLYRNQEGKFRDVAAEAGVEDIGPGMSAAWFDYDGDGQPDLYVSNMWTAPGKRVIHDPAFQPSAEFPEAYKAHTNGNSLYRNRGGGRFEPTGDNQGVAMGRWAWSSGAFDFDNDGTPEICITAGMLTNSSTADLSGFFWRRVVAASPGSARFAPEYENGWNAINELIREDYSWCGRERNVFYRRPEPVDGQAARFYDFSGVSGLDYADDSRAFAVADVDGDGNLDLLLKSRLGPQLRVLRNNCGHGKPTAAFRLRGTKANRDAIGARVEVDGRVQFVTAGSGFLSQHSKTLYFALPSKTSTVRITWPSGAVETHENIQPGFRYDVTEGSANPGRVSFRPRTAWSSTPVEPVNTPEPADVWLLEPVPTPDRIDRAGFLVLYSGERPPLPTGVPVHSTDLASSPPEVASRYAVLRRYLLEYRRDLELPIVLLLDDQSRVHKFYSSVPDSQTAQADWKRMQNPERLSVALPFDGQYFRKPSRNYFKLGAAFFQAGFPDRALPYLNEELRRNNQNWKALNAKAKILFDGGQHREALQSYRDVLSIKSDYTPAFLGAGEAAMALGDLNEAEKLFSAVRDDRSSGADAANQLGLVRVRQNRQTEAKRMFEEAIQKQKTHSGAVNNLGVLYMQMGQSNDAIAAFEFGIQQVPEDEQLYLNLGRVYVSLGQMDRARDTMHRLLVKKPGDPAATRALAQLNSR